MIDLVVFSVTVAVGAYLVTAFVKNILSLFTGKGKRKTVKPSNVHYMETKCTERPKFGSSNQRWEKYDSPAYLRAEAKAKVSK